MLWSIDPADGGFFERGQPSTASKSMPHMVTFDGLKFSGVNRANPNDSPGPTHDTGATGEITQQNSKAIVWPSYQPEADGFMRLDDIKGEFSPAREVDGISNQTAQLRDGAVHQDTPMDTHPNDYITTIGQQGYTEVEWTYLKDGVGKNDIPQDVHPNHLADGLLQQPSDFAGLINPDSMRPVDFANNQVMFETGLPVEGIGASNPMGIEPNQMMGSISRGDMFAAANELRSDNRF